MTYHENLAHRAGALIRLPAPVFDPQDVPDAWLHLPRTAQAARRQGLPWFFAGQCQACSAFAIRRVGQGCPQCAKLTAKHRRTLRLENVQGGAA